MITHLGTFTVNFMGAKDDVQCESLQTAMRIAEQFVGNHAFTRPFPEENTYLYGPGDGSVSCMIREDIKFADWPETA